MDDMVIPPAWLSFFFVVFTVFSELPVKENIFFCNADILRYNKTIKTEVEDTKNGGTAKIYDFVYSGSVKCGLI